MFYRRRVKFPSASPYVSRFAKVSESEPLGSQTVSFYVAHTKPVLTRTDERIDRQAGVSD